ncbi:MAG: ABC transporter substrate-binding protein [Desulfobacteraceae bacterium]|nr:ABC transporter substrate-binding protein [Desulfobacteraceae bacterium]
MKTKKKGLVRLFWVVALGFLATGLVTGGATGAWAAEKVSVAIISFSPYAPWYIVKEKGLAKGIDLDIRIIEGITAKNSAITSGKIQLVMNTLDTMVLARAAGVPIKIIAIPALSYGLDEMIVGKEIKSVKDFPGKTYGADYGFLNHMWMLLTLKRAGIGFNELKHVSMLPQESAAAFNSGNLDIDVNYIPFSLQTIKRPGSHILKTSLTDRTWERGLISESISVNEKWLREKPEVAKEVLRAWFEAVNWWKENPNEGNKIIAKGLDWPIEDVRLNQYGAIILNLDQNLGAFGIADGKPPCMSIPDGAPRTSTGPSGWGKELFGGTPDCVRGYVYDTYNLFNDVYIEAGVAQAKADAKEGLSTTILQQLLDDGYREKYSSNKWIGRVGK